MYVANPAVANIHTSRGVKQQIAATNAPQKPVLAYLLSRKPVFFILIQLKLLFRFGIFRR